MAWVAKILFSIGNIKSKNISQWLKVVLYDPENPEVPGNDDDDNEDEQDYDETTPFRPGSASKPGPGGEEIPMQTMHHEKSGLPDTS